MEYDLPAGPDGERESSDDAVSDTPGGCGSPVEDPPGRAPEPIRSDRPSDGTAHGTPVHGTTRGQDTTAQDSTTHGTTPAHGARTTSAPANRKRGDVSRTPVDRIGSLLPDRAAEDDPERWGDRRDESDGRYLEDVPPHHGN